MRIPHPIPYQGSKRHLARLILPLFPAKVKRLVEPFAGSAAVSIAAACSGNVERFHLNDINRPLMDLWRQIIQRPKAMAEAYEKLWREQEGREREFYDLVRHEFNKSDRPDCFLFLLARCVKASVRYNACGEFNQSPDNRRKGRRPASMRRDILNVSRLLRGRTILTSEDYRQVLRSVEKSDLLYMDPPYQGVSGTSDTRYSRGVDAGNLVEALRELAQRRICFILSYDGRTGVKSHGQELPARLGLRRIEIKAGRSAQSTLLGGSDITYESIYVSQELVKRLK